MSRMGTPTVMERRLAAAIFERMERQYEGLDFPRTREAFQALLDGLRPEGVGYLWPRCRKAVAEQLGLRLDNTFHNWFDIMTRLR